MVFRTDRTLDLHEVVERGGFCYHIYVPDGVPGYECDVATVLHRDPSETQRLLETIDRFADGAHLVVSAPRLVRERMQGSKGEVIPAQYEVTVSRG